MAVISPGIAISLRVRAQVLADFQDADPAHDIDHLDRVAALAARIAGRVGANPEAAAVAAYVHDYHRVEEARLGRHPIRPEEALPAILAVLDACDVPQDWRAPILGAVELTGRYSFAGEDVAANHPVAAAVHDADNLDAIGMIGVGRAFAYGGLLGEPLWRPDSGLKDVYQEGHTSSVLAHVYEKLLRLEADMLTEPARALAADRTAALRRFAAEFRAEWEPVRDGERLLWDARTWFLSLTRPSAENAGPDIRIGYQGSAGIGFDADGRVTDVNLLEVPDALGVCVPNAKLHAAGPAEASWWLDPETAWVFVPLAEAPRRRFLTGPADVEVVLRAGRLEALRLHFRDTPKESA